MKPGTVGVLRSRVSLRMAPNEHLLNNFSTSKETLTLGVQILRLAQAKTGQGSGRELRELRTGLPAASILIACEQCVHSVSC